MNLLEALGDSVGAIASGKTDLARNKKVPARLRQMTCVIVDTGPLVALLDRLDQDHE